MRVEGYSFAGLAVFFLAADVVYWRWSGDPTGSTAIAFAFMLALLISFYSLVLARRVPPRPEDRGDAEISEGAGEVGFFSPHSYWPISLGAGAALTTLGIIFGLWLAIIGGALLMVSVVGLLFEYYVTGQH